MNERATATNTENDGRQWFTISGIDSGTGYVFQGQEYGMSENGEILDGDGFPLTEGDFETIAVRNVLG